MLIITTMLHRSAQMLLTLCLLCELTPPGGFLFVSSSPGSRRSIFGNVLKNHGIFVPKTPIRLLPKFGEVIDGSLRTKLFRWPKENTIEVKPVELTSFLKSIPHFTSASSAGLIMEGPHQTLHSPRGTSSSSSLRHKKTPTSQQNYQLVDIHGLNGYNPGHTVDQPFSDGTYPETLTVQGNGNSVSFLKDSGILEPVAFTADAAEDELRLWKIKPSYEPVQFFEVQSHQSHLSPSPLQAQKQLSSINQPQQQQQQQQHQQQQQQQQQSNQMVNQMINSAGQNNLQGSMQSGSRQVITHHVSVNDVRPVFSGSENKPIIHPILPCNPALIAASSNQINASSPTTIIRVPVPVSLMATVQQQNQQSQSTHHHVHQIQRPAPISSNGQQQTNSVNNVQNNDKKTDSRSPPIIFYRPNDPDLAKVPKNRLFPIFIPDPSTYEVRSSQVTMSTNSNNDNNSNNQPQQVSRLNSESLKAPETKSSFTLTASTSSSSSEIKAEPAPRRRPPVRPTSHVLAIERESARTHVTAKKRQTHHHHYRHHVDPLDYENSEEMDNYRFNGPTQDPLSSSDTDDLADNFDSSSDRPFMPFSSYGSPHRGSSNGVGTDYNGIDEDSKSAASDPKGTEYRLPLDGSKIPRSRQSLNKSRPRPSSSMSLSLSAASSPLPSSSSTSSPSSSSSPSMSSHISVYPSSDEVKVINPEDAETTSQETSLKQTDRKTFDKGYERSKHRLYEQKVEELWKEKKWNNIGKEESETETHRRLTEKEIPWLNRRRDRRRPVYSDKRPLKYAEKKTYYSPHPSAGDEIKPTETSNKNDLPNYHHQLQPHSNVNSNHNSNNNGFEDGGDGEITDGEIKDSTSTSEFNLRKKDDGIYSNNWSAEAGSSGWRKSYRS